MCLVYIVGIIQRMSLGVIKDDLEQAFQLTDTAYASLVAVFFYVYMAMQIPAGLLVDSVGVRVTASAGILLAGAGSLLFGFAPTVFWLAAGRMLVGLGASVLFVSILKTQSSWFHEREFTTLTGLTNLLGNTGGMLAQTPFVLLVSLVTWRTSFVMLGVFSLAMAALVCGVVRNGPAGAGAAPGAPEKVRLAGALLDVLRNRRVWPPFVTYASCYGCLFTLTGSWGQSYLKSVYGMSNTAAANCILLPLAGFAAASIAVGWASDRLRRRKLPMIVLGALNLLSWAALVLPYGGKPPLHLLQFLLFMIGFATACYVPVLAYSKEINNPKYVGISTSVMNIGGFVGAAVIPVVFGCILDSLGGAADRRLLYGKALFMCLICISVGYACMFFIKETGCRNIYGGMKGSGKTAARGAPV